MRAIVAAVLLTTAIGVRVMAQHAQTAQIQQVSEPTYSDTYRGYSTAKLYGPGDW